MASRNGHDPVGGNGVTGLAAAAANPLWFVSRGLGAATLALLTASLLVGVVAGAGVRSPGWPRFASAGLHRNLSLLALSLLVVHVATAVLDPFARIRWQDALVPFVAFYRPVWLGLGAIAFDVLLAVSLSTVLRRRIGYRAWRTIHWAAYASWPPAILHGLGTGTDTRAPWMASLAAMCLVSVTLLVCWRVGRARVPGAPAAAARVLVVACAVGVLGFTIAGPLRPGWARVAGTPVEMLGVTRKARVPVPQAVTESLVDPSTGAHRVRATIVARAQDAGAWLLVTDLADPSFQVVVRPARADESAPVLAVLHDGKIACIAPAAVSDGLSAKCAGSNIHLVLAGRQPDALGWLSVTPG